MHITKITCQGSFNQSQAGGFSIYESCALFFRKAVTRNCFQRGKYLQNIQKQVDIIVSKNQALKYYTLYNHYL